MAAGYKKGDRVRVTLEATVTHPFTDDDAGLSVRFDDDVLGECTIGSSQVKRGEVSFEKIEPPAEVFGPGDVVRSKTTGTVRTLGYGGWVNHATGNWYPDKNSRFTSGECERVDLS